MRLFPLGIVFAFAGAGVWILFALQLFSYPGLEHARFMVGGFLLSFVCGFLMTAAPKFTASFPAEKWEIYLAFLLCAIPVYNSTLPILFLIFFLVRRFRARKQNPPPFFVFVFLGIACGLIGSLLINFAKDEYYIFGRIPAVNETKIFGGYEFTILSRKKQNVELVKFRVLDNAIN